MKRNKRPLNPTWPAISYENLQWTPSHDFLIPRSQDRIQRGKYAAAVAPAIAETAVAISDSVAAVADEASAEIARFDGEMGLAVAPFTALLLRSESAASSKIENLTASAKAIALAELGDTAGENASEIVANTKAMEAAIALSDRLDEQSILDMHDVLMHTSEPEIAGRLRTEQVWIGGSNFGPIGALFVPPSYQRVPLAIEDLVRFLQRDDLPTLVQASIAHAQFETIHPFADGNGRTGRALLHAVLRSKRLVRSVTIPLSAGLLTDTQRYFDALNAYREGNIEILIEMMADAAFIAINNGRRLVRDLQKIEAEWTEVISARRGAAAWRLAEMLVRQPVVDSQVVQGELGITAPSANAAIEHLVQAGVLQQVSGNQRNRKWAASAVLKALDSFASRAGRRG